MEKVATIVLPGTKFFKKFTVKTVFFILGRSLASASKFEPRIRREVASWEEGFSIMMKVLPSGPCLGWKKENGTLIYMGSKLKKAELIINFKNLTSAFLLMTPQIGVAEGFAQHRMTVIGDLAKSISFNRCLNILLPYLYPDFICKRLLKEIPEMKYERFYRMMYLYLIGVPLGL